MNEELKNEINSLFEKHGIKEAVLTLVINDNLSVTYQINNNEGGSVLSRRLAMYASVLESADHVKNNITEAINDSELDEQKKKDFLEYVEFSIGKLHEMRNKMNQTDNTSIH